MDHVTRCPRMLPGCLTGHPGAAGMVTGLTISQDKVCVCLGIGRLLVYSSGPWVREHGGEVRDTPILLLSLEAGSGLSLSPLHQIPIGISWSITVRRPHGEGRFMLPELSRALLLQILCSDSQKLSWASSRHPCLPVRLANNSV